MNDEGNITITAAGISAALFSLLGVAAFAASEVIAVHRSQVASDMAAVSAAHAFIAGQKPCAQAAETALRHHADVLECEIEGGDVTVRTSFRGRSTQAKAGPI